MTDDPDLNPETPATFPETNPAPAAVPAPTGDAANTRLPNPFVPGDEAGPTVATEPTSYEQAKRLWLGGEHARARMLFEDMDLTDEQRADLPTLPGWNEV